MILYSANGSPYSAPVRIVVYAKHIELEIAEPPGGLGSSRFSAINPVGTIPCLVLDDGLVLPESAAIMEYLEDAFPEPALMPASARARAEIRVLQRISELGVLHHTVELRALLKDRSRDEAVFNSRLTRLLRGLASADIYVTEKPVAADPDLSLADCHLAPALFLVTRLIEAGSIPDILSSRPNLGHYLERRRRHPAIERVLGEIAGAID